MAIIADIKALLDSRGREGGVYSRLDKGDSVQSLVHVYHIDDAHILDYLASGDSFPYNAVRDLFAEYNGRNGEPFTMIPFSEAIKNKRGTCTEHAIAGQLAAQAQKKDFYLVGGYVLGKDGLSFHYFNVGRFPQAWCLVDITNPLRNGKPYIAPITGINTETLGFVIPWTDLRSERNYFLSRMPSEIPDDFPFM